MKNLIITIMGILSLLGCKKESDQVQGTEPVKVKIEPTGSFRIKTEQYAIKVDDSKGFPIRLHTRFEMFPTTLKNESFERRFDKIEGVSEVLVFRYEAFFQKGRMFTNEEVVLNIQNFLEEEVISIKMDSIKSLDN